MAKISIDKKELDALKRKAEQWDKLEDKISKYFTDESGEYSEENPQIKGDLTNIAEDCLAAFGWAI